MFGFGPDICAQYTHSPLHTHTHTPSHTFSKTLQQLVKREWRVLFAPSTPTHTPLPAPLQMVPEPVMRQVFFCGQFCVNGKIMSPPSLPDRSAACSLDVVTLLNIRLTPHVGREVGFVKGKQNAATGH